MSTDPLATSSRHPPLADLEQTFIVEFLRSRGFDTDALAQVPKRKREALLKEASLYACGRLAEVESRSHLLEEIGDGDDGG